MILWHPLTLLVSTREAHFHFECSTRADIAFFPCCKQAALPVFQTSPSLFSLWAWSPAAEHTLQPPSVQGPKRKTEKQRSAASVADWQLESPGQVACTISSSVSGLRRGDKHVPTAYSPAAGSQVPKCWALGTGLGASFPLQIALSMLSRHSSLPLRSCSEHTRICDSEEKIAYGL